METDNPISKLYEASMEGSVTSFESLIKNDRLILDKISLSPFSETPLHVSALLGHTRFAEALVDLCPGLARRLDYHGRSPLHLAAANGHADTVRALLSSRHRGDNDDMCLVRDREGRVALHYAAMRGHVAAAEALAAAEPRSVWEGLLPGGETVAHLCVRYNQLEALRVLVELLSSSSSPDAAARLLNSNDNADGNTVLHLAVLLKQIETVKYLVSVPGVKQDTQNHKGFKPSELIDQLQTDFTTLKLNLIITSTTHGDDNRVQSTEQALAPQRCQLAVRIHDRTLQWLESEQMRASILVVATLIAQTTFQLAINPPSIVREQTTTKDVIGPDIASSVKYLTLIVYNTVSFLASLGAVLLLVGGFPHKSRFFAWLMAVVMLVALTFMVGTYLMAIQMVAPDRDFSTVFTVVNVSFEFWIAILGIVSAIHLVFLLVWLLNKFPLTRRLGLCFNSSLEMGRS